MKRVIFQINSLLTGDLILDDGYIKFLELKHIVIPVERTIVNSSSPNIKAHRWFFCVDKFQFNNLPNNAVRCKGDCRKCNLCFNSRYQGVIYCKQH